MNVRERPRPLSSKPLGVSLKRNFKIMTILAYILSGLSLLMSVHFLIRSPKPPLGFIVAFFKLTAGALSPYWAIMGAVGAVIGWVYQALWAIPMGIVGAGMMIWYVWRCTRDHTAAGRLAGALLCRCATVSCAPFLISGRQPSTEDDGPGQSFRTGRRQWRVRASL
jgi:hypothetical protein